MRLAPPDSGGLGAQITQSRAAANRRDGVSSGSPGIPEKAFGRGGRRHRAQPRSARDLIGYLRAARRAQDGREGEAERCECQSRANACLSHRASLHASARDEPFGFPPVHLPRSSRRLSRAGFRIRTTPSRLNGGAGSSQPPKFSASDHSPSFAAGLACCEPAARAELSLRPTLTHIAAP
jgi:hypothetical protein